SLVHLRIRSLAARAAPHEHHADSSESRRLPLDAPLRPAVQPHRAEQRARRGLSGCRRRLRLRLHLSCEIEREVPRGRVSVAVLDHGSPLPFHLYKLAHRILHTNFTDNAGMVPTLCGFGLIHTRYLCPPIGSRTSRQPTRSPITRHSAASGRSCVEKERPCDQPLHTVCPTGSSRVHSSISLWSSLFHGSQNSPLPHSSCAVT